MIISIKSLIRAIKKRFYEVKEGIKACLSSKAT